MLKTPIALLSGFLSLCALCAVLVLMTPQSLWMPKEEKQEQQKSAPVPQQSRTLGPLTIARSGRCLTLTYRMDEGRARRVRLLCVDGQLRPSR